MELPLIETPRQRRKRLVKKSFANVLLALLTYAALVLTARLLHRRVLYQPPKEVPGDPPDGVTVLTITAADGVTVHALELPPMAPAPAPAPVAGAGHRPPAKATPSVPAATETRVVVLFHGNAETADDSVAFARELRRRGGFGVVLAEYRGYGRSHGAAPTEEGLYLDAAALLDLLAARGIGRERIVLWGQSLGTGVATEMARRGRAARLVLVAPFTSTVDMARRIAPFLPAGLVMADRFESIVKAPEISIPALVVHGDIDDVIPFEQGERLSKALPHCTFLKVAEGKHDNLYKSITVLEAAVKHAGS